MVKSEIVKELKKIHPSLKSSQIESIVDIIFNSISDNLVRGKSTEIRKWGRFSIKTIKEKKSARNPKSGEIIYVPKKKKISFKASKHLKEEINK